MIRVNQIVIREFRGIRDLTVDFKNKSFAICGPNGTGKSGIVDALEFALTGNISRLSGRGTGGLSVKEHAPHVDSRNRPDKAEVELVGYIPSLKKSFSIKRAVKTPGEPTITPADDDVLAVLNQVASHPEFVLSRRELIKYVLSAPGDRAKEVQVLLQLDRVEDVRALLQKVMNACRKEVDPLKREKEQAQIQLTRALGIPELRSEVLIAAVNTRRTQLNLSPLVTLTATTSLRDGLDAAATTVASRVPKVQATNDLKGLRQSLAKLADADAVAAVSSAKERLVALSGDPLFGQSVERERFLELSLGLITDASCPLCDTPWDPAQLKERVKEKMGQLEQVSKARLAIEQQLEPLVARLNAVIASVAVVSRYGAQLSPKVDTTGLAALKTTLESRSAILGALLPLSETITALRQYGDVAELAIKELEAIETAVTAIPEPTEQDAARDYLTVAQERLEAFRGVSSRLKEAGEKADRSRKVYEVYASVSTKVLEGIYKQVEKDFADFYRLINKVDEEAFSAQLVPSTGKLGFDVDFYGRGFFPPGAYHSEGHQDGMGVCLYLALMRYLLGDQFRFAVLDDVLMSVDSGHRRDVCRLLKEHFPNTQFVLTTHDEIWLRHMKTVGLIESQSYLHFRKWDVDHGPTEWDNRDVWKEIDDYLSKSDVRSAAALLRHYLEYVSAEICHYLRAPVEFRGDAQFQLGDLLPAAIGRYRSLLKEAKASAQSWGQADLFNAITTKEEEFAALATQSNVEQWQINPSVHYNEWATLQRADFTPVGDAFKNLVESFACANPECLGLCYVSPERGPREGLRCRCGAVNYNLLTKPKQKK